jgi:hypothetical protein
VSQPSFAFAPDIGNIEPMSTFDAEANALRKTWQRLFNDSAPLVRQSRAEACNRFVVLSF